MNITGTTVWFFAVWKVPKASVGFSSFELLFCQKPYGVLDLFKENWEEGPSLVKENLIHSRCESKATYVGRLSQENLLRTQEHQQVTH